jgi:hypothetical protein
MGPVPKPTPVPCPIVPCKNTIPDCATNVSGAEAFKDTGDVGLPMTLRRSVVFKDWPSKKPPKDTVGADVSLANPYEDGGNTGLTTLSGTSKVKLMVACGPGGRGGAFPTPPSAFVEGPWQGTLAQGSATQQHSQTAKNTVTSASMACAPESEHLQAECWLLLVSGPPRGNGCG